MGAVEGVLALLRDRGADEIEHPSGTLLGHLRRVHERLGGLGLDTRVQLAGLAHAVYGTDGFEVVLLDTGARERLRAVVGAEAELLGYELRPFVDLSMVNELDLVEQSPLVAEKHGDFFRSLFGSWDPLASPQVMTEARRVLRF